MRGKLYGIGIGPGDPELITIKAKNILEKVDYIAIPKTSSDNKNYALSIVEGIMHIDPKRIIELIFPMSYDEKILETGWEIASKSIIETLDKGKNIAFITLGDPTVYSTYMYVHKVIQKQGYITEIVPGVTSFCASAAKAGISLGENSDCIAIVPQAYDCENLDDILESFDSVVLMKASKNFNGLLQKLEQHKLEDKAVLISKCGHEDEVIQHDLTKINTEKLSYFTTVIIKKRGVIK